MNPLGTRCFGLAPKKATFKGFPLSGTLFHFLSHRLCEHTHQAKVTRVFRVARAKWREMLTTGVWKAERRAAF